MPEFPEAGDIVVYIEKDTFPMGSDEERKAVVEGVDEAAGEVDLGVDGVVPIHRIVEIRGKSPSVKEEDN